MSTPDKVHELIERFGRNPPAYKQGQYNEVLGWDVHKRLAAETVPHVKTVLQRQIEATDRQIDQLVYELYELTAEEIAVVEGG